MNRRISNYVPREDLFARATLDAFRRDPVGHYLREDAWLCFCPSPSLWIGALWGSPTPADVHEFLSALEVQLTLGKPYGSIFDVSGLESVTEPVFEAIAGYLQRHEDAIAQMNKRHAVVRPSGMVGAVAAGFYQIHPSPKPRPVQVFTTLRQALEWIDPGLPRLEALAIDELCQPWVGSNQKTVSRLQALLRTRLVGIDLVQAAEQLGMSVRTLQRHLRVAGTTFRRELETARIHQAGLQLEAGERSVTEVALELGFASSQSFWRQFRRMTGVSPSDWRRTRGSAA